MILTCKSKHFIDSTIGYRKKVIPLFKYGCLYSIKGGVISYVDQYLDCL
ncbi:hypothetical protein CLV62_13249 [Dysgonomonas alginatilytica]|uniref:Uncharacterized protein n=1 Tax=Dysgonomonas alginatilytica TaxID=1605892 RepID=A0A2V3PLR0_9BACT|nr:hypothetical protein CLV62_13249 [Dysgonomonas alginatilytica]